MQNYQHPNIPELYAGVDGDGTYSVFLRGQKALEEVSKEDLKHLGFHVEKEEQSHKIVLPIGIAGEDIKTGHYVQVCDRGVVMKYRGRDSKTESKQNRITKTKFDEFVSKNHKILSSESIERFVKFLKDNDVWEK